MDVKENVFRKAKAKFCSRKEERDLWLGEAFEHFRNTHGNLTVIDSDTSTNNWTKITERE